MDRSALLLLLLVASELAIANDRNLEAIDPDSRRNTSELIVSRGYAFEEYDFETSDGYILKLYRMPCSRAGKCGGAPVFLMHGLLCSSDMYVLDSTEQSLAYVLSEQGFDVWLPNKRGNLYSSRHRSLSKDDEAFWQFTWDDVALIDIPEQIDFIIKKTGYSSVGYVGHSEGTTTGFAAATRSDIAGKINTMVMLAPIANMTKINSELLKILAALGQDELYRIFGHKSFLSHGVVMNNYFLPEVCHECPSCCLEVLFSICGAGKLSNYNKSRVEVWVGRFPAGTSVTNMIHWVQSIDSREFSMFNWGEEENLNRYGSKQPPYYDLHNVPMPIWLFTGGKDLLSTSENVETLMKTLPSEKVTLWNDPHYNHVDFVFGLDAQTKVYPLVVKALYSASKFRAV